MVEPTFGITITREDNEPRSVIPSDMSTIGFVGTAPLADEDAFPLDTPILVRTSDTVLMTKLGATGTLADALQAVADQLGDFQAAAQVVVVRVEEGVDTAATLVNLIGDNSDRTGLYAFLDAPNLIGVTPRLIGVPGYTHQQLNGLGTITVTAPGASYTTPPAVAFTGGGGTGATAHAVLGTGGNAGKVTSIVVDNPGTGYTTAPTIGLTGGGGTGATATVQLTQLANAVCAALPGVLSQLIAHAVVEGPGTTEQAAKDWRETINSERLIPIDMWVKVLDDDGNIATRPGAPRVLGLGARIDYDNRGAPFHSWANRPIQGIVGFVRDVPFSLTDGATEGQSLLASNIGIGVRGEMGVESAISGSGFTFIGTDNAGDDSLWQFYNVTRGRDYIHLGLLKTLRVYLGRFNITGHTIQAVLNTATVWLGDLQANEHILGFRVGFDEDANSPENLRLGRFNFFFEAEEPPVLRRIDIKSRRFRQALTALVNDLMTTVGSSSVPA